MASASYLMHYCQCLAFLGHPDSTSENRKVVQLHIVYRGADDKYRKELQLSDKISIKGAFFNPSPSLVSLLAIHTILCTKLKTLDGN